MDVVIDWGYVLVGCDYCVNDGLKFFLVWVVGDFEGYGVGLKCDCGVVIMGNEFFL